MDDWRRRLRRLRMRLGFGVERLADALGVPLLEVLELEAGKRRFSRTVRAAIVRVERRDSARSLGDWTFGRRRAARHPRREQPFGHAAYLGLLYDIARRRAVAAPDFDEDDLDRPVLGWCRRVLPRPSSRDDLRVLERRLAAWRMAHGAEIDAFPLEATCREFGLSEAERWVLIGLMSADRPLYEGPGEMRAGDLLRIAGGDRDAALRNRALLLDAAPLCRRGLIQPAGGEHGVSLFARHSHSDGFFSQRFALTEEGRRRVFGDLLESGIEWKKESPTSRIERPPYGLGDVVLPAGHRRRLDEVLAQARQGPAFFERWGLAKTVHYGRGLLLLFQGPPGTGKTLTAGALARELGRPLLVADFGKIESCWVGETEKNLGRLFREAKAEGAVLFIDEADGLLATRELAARSWEIRDVNVLLQELERFDGVAVMATNNAGVLDPALESRCALRLAFPMPGPAERERIFRAHIPPEYPLTADVDFASLARRYKLSGRHIKNVVLAAARRAVRDGREVVIMADFEAACRDQAGAAPEAGVVGFRCGGA
jgi:transcriptional regulator with XRE-family HTH domain